LGNFFIKHLFATFPFDEQVRIITEELQVEAAKKPEVKEEEQQHVLPSKLVLETYCRAPFNRAVVVGLIQTSGKSDPYSEITTECLKKLKPEDFVYLREVASGAMGTTLFGWTNWDKEMKKVQSRYVNESKKKAMFGLL
jgi:hypothetical protein